MNEWINGAKAIDFLYANKPFNDAGDAETFFLSKIKDGSLPVRDRNTKLVLDPADVAQLPFQLEVRPLELRKLCQLPPAPTHPGGRPTEYDYEDLLIYLCALMHNDPAFRTPTEDDLFDAAKAWATKKYPDGGPDPRLMRKRVKLLHQRVFVDDES